MGVDRGGGGGVIWGCLKVGFIEGILIGWDDGGGNKRRG